MSQLPTTQLLPDFDFVLLHAGFKSKLAYLCRQYDKVGEQSILELKKFAHRIEKVKNVIELKDIVSKSPLEISKIKPEAYYDNGYTRANDLFYSLPVSIEHGDLGAIYFFFPVLFKEYDFSEELSCCSHENFFANPKDTRCLEVFYATYRPRFHYTC